MLFGGGRYLTPSPPRHHLNQNTHTVPPPLIRFRLPSCRYQVPPHPQDAPTPVPHPDQIPPPNFPPCIHAPPPPAWLPPPPPHYTSPSLGKFSFVFYVHFFMFFIFAIS